MTLTHLLVRCAIGCAITVACVVVRPGPAGAQTRGDAGPGAPAAEPADADPVAAPGEAESAGEAAPEELSVKVERLAAEANVLVAAGDFQGAIARYLEAYRASQAGALLYNIAYIYDRKLGQPELALEHYKRYLGAEDAELDIVRRALDRIRALHDAGVSSARGQGGGTAGSGPRRQGSSPGSGMKIAGFAIGGLGLASTITGAVFGGLALSTRDEYSASHTSSLKRRGQTQAVLSDAFLWPGLALTATGVVLVLLAPSGEDDAGDSAAGLEVRPAAAVGPGGVFMGVEGAW